MSNRQPLDKRPNLGHLSDVVFLQYYDALATGSLKVPGVSNVNADGQTKILGPKNIIILDIASDSTNTNEVLESVGERNGDGLKKVEERRRRQLKTQFIPLGIVKPFRDSSLSIYLSSNSDTEL
jgi:hypothetical protein